LSSNNSDNLSSSTQTAKKLFVLELLLFADHKVVGSVANFYVLKYLSAM